MKKFIYLALFTAPISLISVAAQADVCPVPDTNVETSVQSNVSWDPKTQLYTYRYSVQNLKSSPLSVDRFLVLTNPQPKNVVSPAHWDPAFDTEPSRQNWSTFELDPSHPEYNVVGGYSGPTPHAFFAIKPGNSLDGFSFQSPYPPAVTKYMVQGDTDIPTSTPTAENDEPVPNCPGWDFNGPKYEIMNTGITQGPADPNVLYARIRLRDRDGDRRFETVDPQHAKGQIGVLVLNSKSFDASTIDLSSISFGPGKAKPLSSRLVPGKDNDDKDEREGWEKFAGHSFEHDGKDQDKARKNLFLVFDLKSVGIRCVLDHALFFSANTKDNKPVFGGVSIKTIGCHLGKKETKEREKK